MKQTVFLIHQSPLTAIGKHPYETIIATSDTKSNIFIWDTSGFIVLNKFQSKIANGALSLQFNPNGSKLAAVFFDSSYVLGLFDSNRGIPLAYTRISEGPIRDVRFKKIND